jgi:hypothetical protein
MQNSPAVVQFEIQFLKMQKEIKINISLSNFTHFVSVLYEDIHTQLSLLNQ